MYDFAFGDQFLFLMTCLWMGVFSCFVWEKCYCLEFWLFGLVWCSSRCHTPKDQGEPDIRFSSKIFRIRVSFQSIYCVCCCICLGILAHLPHIEDMVGQCQGLCQVQGQGAGQGTCLLPSCFSFFFLLPTWSSFMDLWLIYPYVLQMINRSRESSEVENPGNNLYVTGLSTRVTKRELEKHFASEGSVCQTIF